MRTYAIAAGDGLKICDSRAEEGRTIVNDLDDARGILRPTRLPTFHRVPAPEELQELVRWFWIPRWQIPPGRTSRQHLLPFPASNLVVEPGGVVLSGPSTGASYRDLTGTGWAVGALLRPAGIAQLHPDPAALRDLEVAYDAGGLHGAVVGAMERAPGGAWTETNTAAARERATAICTRWALDRLEPPDEAGLLANAMEDLVAGDPTVVRVEQVARHLHVSTRAVQRLAHRHVGLPPLAIVRRYRLQEAARRLREEPSTTVAEVAAELGYADHAHLTRDFRQVLGLSPRDYRRGEPADD